jgi:capsular exopolysaccharide synthesis family protein
MISFLVIGALAGTAYVILKTPRYQAATTVELVGFNQSFMNRSQVDPQAGTDTTTASASNIQTQTRILTSRSLLSRVQERMNLEMTQVTSSPTTFFTKLRSQIPFRQKEPFEEAREAVREAALSVLARGVGASRLIEIKTESPSPEVAANFLNTLATEHISQNLAARSNVTQQTSQWMESQLKEDKSRLQEAEEKLREFIQKSGLDFFPEQSTLADTKLRQLQADVSVIQADRIAKQARWELAKKAPLDSLPDLLNDPNLQNLKIRITDLRREKAQLTATLTPEHYKVQRIQAQITELEQAFKKEKTGILERLNNDYEEALRREKLLSGAYNTQTHAVGAQLDKSSQYAMLKRDLEMAQQVYTTLLQQSNQAALIALAPESNIRVVDPAIPINIPSSPLPARDIPMWSFLSGGLGYGLLWFRESVRRRKLMRLVEAPGNLRTVLGVPELGVIPSAPAAESKKLWKKRTTLSEAGAENARQIEFATWQKSSLLAESFRQTLTSIMRTKPADHNPVYIVTSVGPGEGKTTLTTNLAVPMAGIGRRVLLIDADLRRSRLHLLFGLPESKGLTDLLNCGDPLGTAATEEFVHATQIQNLQVMTRGLSDAETPSLLFFSSKVQELIAHFQKKYDFILVDTGPVLLFPDARLWGKHADGVVLIVRSGVTTKEDAMTVCQQFAEDGVPVLGTILNDWAPGKAAHRYYYNSYEGYGRKSGERNQIRGDVGISNR